jgi:putative PIN family toxin of toxin-antitoxin system
MRIFLDANILVSGIVFHGNEHTLLTKRNRNITFITSEDVVEETKKVLMQKFPEDAKLIDIFLQLLNLTIIKRELYIHKIQDCTTVRDKKDKHILVVSVAGKADYIVSGDVDLLSLKIHKNIPIIKAKEALILMK